MSTDDLEEAKRKMTASATEVMKTSPPRDLDRAWKVVAMKYPPEFVTDNHAELQRAFDAGLRQTN